MSIPSSSSFSKVLAGLGVLITLGLIVGVILGSSPQGNDKLADSYFQGQAYIDYGNGTVESHAWNVSKGTTAFAVFNSYWNLTFKDYGELGVYVQGINGVMENTTAQLHWIFWFSNAGTEQWQYSNVGVSSFEITKNVDLKFVYSDLSE